ncbi:hypothetical protein FANTH_13687 [Fusarium anthophilum]|uniref:Uncharacterized protein n=1 Tax=Fusarium anthophilum TaxID=48485 RepID=A0A8H5DPC0_9HYPO|nr:hypothetical protein FANTH_13687 [Fusarium anthophilum]
MLGEDLVIYYNDSIDSDNLAAALALFKPNVRVLWILEPRQHFPSIENPFKTLLNGDIKPQDIGFIKDLTKDDRKILEMAVKPKYGSNGDANLHAQLSTGPGNLPFRVV